MKNNRWTAILSIAIAFSTQIPTSAMSSSDGDWSKSTAKAALAGGDEGPGAGWRTAGNEMRDIERVRLTRQVPINDPEKLLVEIHRPSGEKRSGQCRQPYP